MARSVASPQSAEVISLLKPRYLIMIGSNDDVGGLQVHNKTGDPIVSLKADDYGNGEVGVWNCNGKGRVIDSQ